MAKQLDTMLVVDLEATCWNGPNPEGMENEIIEIGIALMDVRTGEVGECTSILVKPERSEVSDFCTELTTLTADQLKAGITFKEACKRLRTEFLSQQRVWGSWGDYDRNQFQRQCASFGVGYPFGPAHINLKNLYAVLHGLDRELGMPSALEREGLPLEGTHHRGIDDARNIARIFGRMLAKFRGAGGNS